MTKKKTYKSMMAEIKEGEEKEEKLEIKLNDLLEEQFLFKNDTFSYSMEAITIYTELIKIREKRIELIDLTTVMQLRREKRLKQKENKKRRRAKTKKMVDKKRGR